jgi:mono/diheme cytochrome c family protein
MKALNIILLLGIIIMIAAMPFVFMGRARIMTSGNPRIHLIQDMDNQIKFKTQKVNPVFADKRAMRQPVAGTVAQGFEHADPHYYEGRVDGDYARSFPGNVDVTESLIKRGQQRYEIFCAPCHGVTGVGNGMVSQRAEQLQEGTWVPPLSYHDDTVLRRPVGHIFNTITNGIRNMPAYGDQISEQDRWAIVAYVRTLQRSHRATIDDVPAEKRDALLDQIK